MNWSEFRGSVLSLVGEDTEDENPIKVRQIDQAIRSACIRLQQVIDAYREGHETIFEVADLTIEGYAHRGEIPDGAHLINLWWYEPEGESGSEDDESDCGPSRIQLKQADWVERHGLITGESRLFNVWTIDPNGNRFYISPMLDEGETLHLFWNGLKLNFADSDTLPWGEDAAEAVSHFVNAQLARKTKDKMGNHQSFMEDWRRGLSLLRVMEQERRAAS